MIAHVSVPAKDPQRTALFFAAVIDGIAFPLPVVPGAWIAVAKDRSGLAVEVYPDTMAHHPGQGEVEPARAAGSPQTMPWEDQIHPDGQQLRPSVFHAAIATALPGDEVLSLARQAGWRALKCERAGVFGVVEVWLENAVLVEVLDAREIARYRQFMHPEGCAAMFGAGIAPQVRAAGPSR